MSKKKKIIVASVLGIAAAGTACAVNVNSNVHAEESDQTSTEQTTEKKGRHSRKELNNGEKRQLTEEQKAERAAKKAELKEKFENMTEEEKAEWKANHPKQHKKRGEKKSSETDTESEQ